MQISAAQLGYLLEGIDWRKSTLDATPCIYCLGIGPRHHKGWPHDPDARLRIILNDIDPMPMRHIEVPLKIRLGRLHEVIQAAMGWAGTHLRVPRR
ncbi:IS1096 element passenger TnpR family protein [Wenxinia marina]|nr:hypothetical protein [Wenxinia marina]